jgi:hypothetical protein
VRFPRIRRFSGWVAYCLCVVLPVLVGCGDYCLFCEGQGSGGGGNGNGGEEICDNVFPGVDKLEQPNLNDLIDGFAHGIRNENRLSLAVIPKGMSFEYGSNRTANPGDVVLADQEASDVYVYEYAISAQTKRLLDLGVDQVSGVALLHQEKADETFADLLFFTVQSENTLYIYDLTGSEAPSPITNQDVDDVFSESGSFFEFPTAIAVSADSEEAVIFVLNDNGSDSSVRRLSVDLDSWDPLSAKTIGTKNASGRPLVDIAFFEKTDALFVSKKTEGEDFAVGWVYRIVDASDRTSSPVNLDSASPYIEAPRNVTGLAIAATNKEGTGADLLVLRDTDGSVEQYDTLVAGEAEAFSFFGALSQFPQAVAYDCTNERLVVTDVPFNDAIPRTFFEAFFTP